MVGSGAVQASGSRIAPQQTRHGFTRAAGQSARCIGMGKNLERCERGRGRAGCSRPALLPFARAPMVQPLRLCEVSCMGIGRTRPQVQWPSQARIARASTPTCSMAIRPLAADSPSVRGSL